MVNIPLIVTGSVIVLIFFLPVFHQVFNFGTIAGSLLGAAVILSGVFWFKIPQYNKTLFLILIVSGLGIIFSVLMMIYKAGKGSAHGQQVVIVLGCRVKGDEPSLALLKRVDAAYRFLLENPSSFAILSGGQGKDENLSEALCMKQLLTDRGIQSSRLILEDKSTSTDENIRYSKEIISKLNLKKEVAVATSEYHQVRAKMVCKRYGLTAAVQSSPTKPLLLPNFLLRELFAIIREYFRK